VSGICSVQKGPFRAKSICLNFWNAGKCGLN